MNPEVTGTNTDILSESDIQYEFATTGQRFLNFLIDNLLMRFGVSFLTGMLLGVVIQLVSPGALQDVAINRLDNYLFLVLVSYVNYIVYYTFCEKLFQGYTLGKLITGTKAVRTDGSSLTFRDALMRSLCRIVPFEAFSGFGIPWHDSWTHTTVIKTR